MTAVCPAELTVKRTSFPATSSRVGTVRADFFRTAPERSARSASRCRLGNCNLVPGDVPSVDSAGQVWSKQFEISLSESSSGWEFIKSTATSSTVSARCRGLPGLAWDARGLRGDVGASRVGVSCCRSTWVATVAVTTGLPAACSTAASKFV